MELKKIKWQDTELDLVETFKEGKYEELLKYVKENEQVLVSSIINDGLNGTQLLLKYGSAKLNFFEEFIKDNSEIYALFKLGELQGYLDYLNTVSYEDHMNKLYKAKFAAVKMHKPKYRRCFEQIIRVLYDSSDIMDLDKLKKKLPRNVKIKFLIDILVVEGFVHFYEGLGYSLSDGGIRIGKMLKEKQK